MHHIQWSRGNHPKWSLSELKHGEFGSWSKRWIGFCKLVRSRNFGSIVSTRIFFQNGKELEESGERSFFLGTLIEMIELHQRSNGIEGFDFETAVAQALIFIVGGFDTSSNLLMWVTYYLAVHPELQEEIRKEIECVLGSGNRVATYEDLTSMKFLGTYISTWQKSQETVPALLEILKKNSAQYLIFGRRIIRSNSDFFASNRQITRWNKILFHQFFSKFPLKRV